MSVNTLHKDYQRYLPSVIKCTDANEGEDAIKGRAASDADGSSTNDYTGYSESYLPVLEGMKRSRNPLSLYKTYLTYASWFAATGRTVQGYQGQIFRKPPQIEGTEDKKVQSLVDSFSIDNKNLFSFSKEMTEKIIVQWRAGVLIDIPTVKEGSTVAEAGEGQAYTVLYRFEQILNWKTAIVDGKEKTILVVLEETYEEPVDDYGSVEKKQYRILYLNDEGNYQIDIYRPKKDKAKDENEFELVEGTEFLVNGKTIDYIPFYPVTPMGISWDMMNPIIKGLTDVNVSHFRNSANYENGLLLTGNPTPCVLNMASRSGDEGAAEIKLGSSTVLQFNEGGKWGFLEFQGTGMDSIKSAMETKEAVMAKLGARNIADQKKVGETAETVVLLRSGEDSILGSLALSVSEALTEILQTMVKWGGSSTKVSYQLNRDFNPFELDANKMNALNNQRVTNGISWETYFHNLQRGEIIPPERSAEEERTAIAKDIKLQSETMGLDDIEDEGIEPENETSGDE